jgi:hypothetical protein
MSGSSQTDDALERLRDAFNTAADETEEMSEKAKQEVEDAIDDLETQINSLR